MNTQLMHYIACYDSNQVWLGSFPINRTISEKIAKQIRYIKQEVYIAAFDDDGNSLSSLDAGFPIDYPLPSLE